jgi:hypothetical protein
VAEIETPVHLAVPFTITKTGAKTNEQGSPPDILASAVNVCECPEGFREDLPQFGRPELLFNTVPLPLSALADAITLWEPDASEVVVEEAAGRVQSERDIGVELG